MLKIQAEIFSLYFFHLGQEFLERALALRFVELVQPLCESLVGSNNNPAHCALASVSFDAASSWPPAGVAYGARYIPQVLHDVMSCQSRIMCSMESRRPRVFRQRIEPPPEQPGPCLDPSPHRQPVRRRHRGRLRQHRRQRRA
jgi:hypothetical protein